MTLDLDLLRAAPKVSLHDHLDGGLRPQTILDLAGEIGHELPASTSAELGRWFFEAASSGSLERYLATFTHTVAVMQTSDNLRRVAREFVEDLAADGVVYGEARWAPEQHLDAGLSPAEAIEAVAAGLREGMDAVAASGREILVQQLVTAMRHTSPSRDIAELAIRYRHSGVAGFDIAGAEAGYPPTRYLDAFDFLKRNNAYFTIHAGEAFGLPSIWEALQICGANRLGHGVRIIDDIMIGEDGRAGPGRPGRLRPQSAGAAGDVPDLQRPDRRAPRRSPSIPIGLLADLRFRVTVNTDNQLMSRTTLVPGVRAVVGGLRLHDRRRPLVHGQRRQERVLPLRRPARHDRERDQAGFRRPRRKVARQR